MRVALAHKIFRLTGGGDVFFHETNRILRAQGHETLMIATGEEADLPAGERTLRLKAPLYDSPGLATKLVSLPAAIYDRSKYRAVKAALAEFRPDVMHVFAMNVHLSPSILTAAEELGIPIVGTFNDYKHICPNYKLFHHGHLCFDCEGTKFYSAVKNNCCKGSRPLAVASMIEAYAHKWMHVYEKFDHFTFSSDFLAEITQRGWKDRKVSWSKLVNPFDSARHVPRDGYDPYGLYFGRLIDEKGVDTLIEAAAQVDFPIKIVGDGPDMEMLKAKAAQLGLTNVAFLGAMWGEPLDAILSRARFVVVPSIWHENFPYVINQAAAMARPVIGSRRGGIPEMVEDGERGLIFDAGNADMLAAHMRALAEDEALARSLGQRAKLWSDTLFRDDVAYEAVMTAYKAAIDEHHSNRR